MASTAFWKERESEFRDAGKENGPLVAVWESICGWHFQGDPEAEKVFKGLARIAAGGVAPGYGADSWRFWLETLRKAGRGCQIKSTGWFYFRHRDLVAGLESGAILPTVTFTQDGEIEVDGIMDTRCRVDQIHIEISSPFKTSADWCLEMRAQETADEISLTNLGLQAGSNAANITDEPTTAEIDGALSGKPAVRPITAAKLIGVKERRIRDLVANGNLQQTGNGMITSDSIRLYISAPKKVGSKRQ